MSTAGDDDSRPEDDVLLPDDDLNSDASTVRGMVRGTTIGQESQLPGGIVSSCSTYDLSVGIGAEKGIGRK